MGKKRAAGGGGANNPKQRKQARGASSDVTGKRNNKSSEDSAPLALMFDSLCENQLFTSPPFVGEEVSLLVFLGKSIQKDSWLLEKGCEVPLKIDVLVSNDSGDSTTRLLNTSEKASSISLVNENPQIDKAEGYCKMSMKFLRQCRPLQLVVRAKDLHSGITPATSLKFNVVTHKLSISKPLEKIWYKDQGGRARLGLPIFVYVKRAPDFYFYIHYPHRTSGKC